MLSTLKKHWKKEYLLIIAALLCLIIYYYRQQLNAGAVTEYLPLVGGLAFGLNTLVQIAK